ncbi:S8 family serine peptidase [Pseudoduganella namucuonensis]|uniref:Subtilase family protein n=1 Tax=Pseudoduganella namucuonensis TaxID=1035707 RepID=A0A1I7ILW3_9BURK|nr:S8 family serine peptidase [Pseudoduganella namucuonensis]SFU73874.1 Subtilase family protein [Pseudoduganella namucuonensis]
MKPQPFALLARPLRRILLLGAVVGAAPAQAQLRLPSLNLPLPQSLGVIDTETLRDRGTRLLASADVRALGELRLLQVGDLLRQHRDVLEPDPRGEPMVRSQILAWSPSAASLRAAKAAGLKVIEVSTLDGLDETIVVLGVPPGTSTAAMLEKLRALDPGGQYDFNHVYTASAARSMGLSAPADAPERPAGAARSGVRIGLIDGGVADNHPVFREAAVTRWGCEGKLIPDAHGTAVAALMIGHSSRFRGVAPGAELYAADVYCSSPVGGSAERIATALGWLAKQQIAVINISLVGPPNQTLERAVGAMVRRGHLLVAAVGNDGPAAAPLYPASYPGVVGVSGVDRDGRTLPEAARGPQVMFAAPGNQMVSAALGNPPYRVVRGTSFAAPIVAAMLAGELNKPEPLAARHAISTLARQASGAPANGVSDAIGYGVLGAAFRNEPGNFR